MAVGSVLALFVSLASAQAATPAAACPYALIKAGDAGRRALPDDECAVLRSMEAPFQRMVDKAVASKLLEAGKVSLSQDIREEESCNAYASHDGKVSLNSATVAHLKKRPSALAYTLAHEIGHHVQEHLSPGTYASRINTTGRAQAEADTFSRQWESEADEIGRKLMDATGQPIDFNRLDEQWNECHGNFAATGAGSHPAEATRWLESLLHRTELEKERRAQAEESRAAALADSKARMRRIASGLPSEGDLRAPGDDRSPMEIIRADAARRGQAAAARRLEQPVVHAANHYQYDEQGRNRSAALVAAPSARTSPSAAGAQAKASGIEQLNLQGRLAVSQYGKDVQTFDQAVQQGRMDCLKANWSKPWTCFRSR